MKKRAIFQCFSHGQPILPRKVHGAIGDHRIIIGRTGGREIECISLFSPIVNTHMESIIDLGCLMCRKYFVKMFLDRLWKLIHTIRIPDLDLTAFQWHKLRHRKTHTFSILILVAIQISLIFFT